MAERPPATDLRGGKASADSFTILMASLVVAYFQPDLFLDTVLGLTVLSEDSGGLLWPLPGTNGVRSETVWGSVLREKWG